MSRSEWGVMELRKIGEKFHVWRFVLHFFFFSWRENERSSSSSNFVCLVCLFVLAKVERPSSAEKNDSLDYQYFRYLLAQSYSAELVPTVEKQLSEISLEATKPELEKKTQSTEAKLRKTEKELEIAQQRIRELEQQLAKLNGNDLQDLNVEQLDQQESLHFEILKKISKAKVLSFFFFLSFFLYFYFRVFPLGLHASLFLRTLTPLFV
jgi:Fe2+ transport system protein B